METAQPERTPVRLTIQQQSLTVLVQGDPQPIQEAAIEVEELLTAIARRGNTDTLRTALLAALHLATRLRQTEQELDTFKAGLAGRTQRLQTLLDSIELDEADAPFRQEAL